MDRYGPGVQPPCNLRNLRTSRLLNRTPGGSSMPTRQSRAERYRRHAEPARRESESLHDPELRQQLLNIAEQYEKLADNIGRQTFPYME
jgi:hypothetical protein